MVESSSALRRGSDLLGVAALSLCLMQGPSALAHSASFTIGQVMQAPFASDLVAANRGKAVAWVFNTRGCRNVWIADAAREVKARALTSFSEDDGFDIGELAWSEDSQRLVFSRGENLKDDHAANVASSAAGPVERQVWMVSVSNGDAHTIAAGHSPKFSPDGKRFAFVRNELNRREASLMIAETDTGKERKLAPAAVIPVSSIEGPSWSPDGKVIVCPSVVHNANKIKKELVAVDAETGEHGQVE